MTEWFRRTTWSEHDRVEFFDRLKRSRGPSKKAQYLRIQALHLQEAGEVRAALELLDLMLADYPETFQLAQAHAQRGACLVALGEPDKGLAAYRAALDAMRTLRTIRNDAYIDFGELVLSLGRSDLYDEVVLVMNEFAGDPTFPIQKYRSSAVLAFAHERLGHPAEARRYAASALDAAAATQSPFRYHRTLGLVTDDDSEVRAHLLALAGRLH